MAQRFVTTDVTNAVTRLLETLGVNERKRTSNPELLRVNRKFNSLKKRTLQVFDRAGGWLDVQAFAARGGFYPMRAAYSYLRRLWRYGLLDRARDRRGRLVYRLSRRGWERLRWLSRS